MDLWIRWRCFTDGATREHIGKGIFNQYKDRKYALRALGKVLHSYTTENCL